MKENEDVLSNTKTSNDNAANGKSDANPKTKDDKEDSKREDEEDKDDLRRAKRKKHFPLNIQIHISGREKPVSIETHSSAKVKNLKLQIQDEIKQEIPAEKMQLQIEGGEILNKNGASLDDYNIQKDCIMSLEVLEKPTPLQTRERKPKEVPKQYLAFKIRGSEVEQKVEV